ncbi:MAG: hypothetical protein ACPGUD_14480 [Parashewanella sp.]
MKYSVIRSYLMPLLGLSIGAFASLAQAETIPINVDCARQGTGAYITVPKYLGFSNVNLNEPIDQISGFQFVDPQTDQHFYMRGMKNGQDFSITADDIYTNQTTGQQMRRIKLNLNSTSVSKVINGQTFPTKDSMTYWATTEFCDAYGTTSNTHEFQVALIHNDGPDDIKVLSEPGLAVDKNSVFVEFKGSPNTPTSIFIENGMTFSNVDLPDSAQDYRLNLTLTPNSNSAHINPIWEFSDRLLAHYNNEGKITSFGDLSQIRMRENEISIGVGEFDSFQAKDNSFSFEPMIIELVQGVDQQGNLVKTHTGRMPPESGWYTPSLTLISKSNVLEPIQLSAKVSTGVDKNAKDFFPQLLMTSGEPFQNDILDTHIFGNDRFYIVDSIDGDGRVRLIRPDVLNSKPEYLDFSKIANGDITWWGSRVRWAKRQQDGSIKIYEGYIGWHSADGSRAFLNLNDGVKSVDTLPSKGDEIAFEFAKVDQ